MSERKFINYYINRISEKRHPETSVMVIHSGHEFATSFEDTSPDFDVYYQTADTDNLSPEFLREVGEIAGGRDSNRGVYNIATVLDLRGLREEYKKHVREGFISAVRKLRALDSGS